MTHHRPRRVHGPAQVQPTTGSRENAWREATRMSVDVVGRRAVHDPWGNAAAWGEQARPQIGCFGMRSPCRWRQVRCPPNDLAACLSKSWTQTRKCVPAPRSGRTDVGHWGHSRPVSVGEETDQGIFLIHNSNWLLLRVSHPLSRPWPPNTLRVLSCLVTSVLTHCPVLGCGGGPGSRHAASDSRVHVCVCAWRSTVKSWLSSSSWAAFHPPNFIGPQLENLRCWDKTLSPSPTWSIWISTWKGNKSRLRPHPVCTHTCTELQACYRSNIKVNCKLLEHSLYANARWQHKYCGAASPLRTQATQDAAGRTKRQSGKRKVGEEKLALSPQSGRRHLQNLCFKTAHI